MAEPATPPSPSKAIVFVRRTASTLCLWALVASIFVCRWTWACFGLTGILTLVATIEYFKMLRTAGVRCHPRFGILLALGYCAFLYGNLVRGAAPPPALDGLAVFIALAGSFALELRRPIRGLESLVSVASNVLGFVYITLLFNFAVQVTFVVPEENPLPGILGTHGSMLLLWLLAVTKFTDMGAYITGSMIGRHKMIPHVSPGKTWEGFAGALVFAQLAACGLYNLFPKELSFFGGISHVIVLGFLLAVLAVIGDLAESVIKRALGAKDSGRMLPGIGGSLDLIDSVCFTAPALYFYLKWFLLPAA